MKFRYLFEKWGEIKGTNELTRDHLVAVKNRNSDFLIDCEEGKYFDAEENAWKDIEAAK